MLDIWLKDEGYHISIYNTLMDVYLHGDYVGYFYRFNKEYEWKAPYNKAVTRENFKNYLK